MSKEPVKKRIITPCRQAPCSEEENVAADSLSDKDCFVDCYGSFGGD